MEEIFLDWKNFKKQAIDTTIKGIRNLFKLEKESEEIKDTILRDIRNLFEQEEEESYYKPARVSNFFGVTIILNTKVKVIEIKHYRLNNILIKLDYIQKTS